MAAKNKSTLVTRKHNPFNPRQMDFLSRYMDPKSPTYGQATKSAIAAGYSEQYADSINCQGQMFQKFLEAQKDNPDLWDAHEILSRLQREADKGVDGEYAKDRIKALELLGKAQKLFTDRIDLSGDLSVTIKMVSYADDPDPN